MRVIVTEVARVLYGENSKRDPGVTSIPNLRWRTAARRATAAVAALSCALAWAQPAGTSYSAGFGQRRYDYTISLAATSAHWLQVPRVNGRITAKDLGLVINTADPYSVEIGEFYIKARKLRPAQVLRVDVPTRAALTPDEFNVFAAAVNAYFGASVLALALAW